MPDSPNAERPNSFPGLKPSLVFTLVIAVMVMLMLVWHARTRIDDFTVQHRLLGKQSVIAAAGAIDMFIKDMHRAIDLFADEQADELDRLVTHPWDNEAHEAFSERIRKHFPEYVNFSYTDAGANRLIGGFEDPIGGKCVTTISNFVSSGGQHGLELHGSRKSPDMPYHFDIMSLSTTSDSDDAVFFLSFRTLELSRILAATEVAGHRLFLILQDDKPLIDMTSEGDAGQLARSPVLEPDELERINFSMLVPGTRWKLVDLSEENLISGAHTSVWTQTAGIFAGFAALIIIILFMIVRDERRRLVAAEALRREHDKLEHRVEERTEALSDSNAALMESEQRYRDLFENTSDLIQSAAPDGKLLYVNRAWRETLGYSEQEVAELDIFDVIHPDCLERCRKMFQELMSGVSVNDIEITFISKDGQAVVVEGSTSCRFNNGKPIATRGIYRDITERKNAEEQAGTHRKELARMTRLSTMGEMASALAHELNQPLTSIANYASGSLARLKKSPDDLEPVVAALQKIAGDAGRTGDFIRHWADFLSRGEIERLPEDLHRTINNVVSLVRPELQQAGITLTLHFADSMPQIRISAIAIEQVILNLIRNSMDAISSTGSRHGKITISTTCIDKEAACITVEDNGPGIPDDLMEKIFDPFCTTKESGMGLGLAISRSIIMAHEGKMWAENLPQGGTVFHVTISMNG